MVFSKETNNSDNLLEMLSTALQVADSLSASNEETDCMQLFKKSKQQPIILLPLILLVRPHLNIEDIELQDDIASPDFIDSGNLRLSTFKAIMQNYATKEYIPLVRFPTNRHNEEQTANILSVVENILVRQLNGWKNVQTGLRYLLGEWVDNITQHAKSEYGYIHAATNPDNNFMDICIADEGITLLGSYKENNDSDIANDMEAMKAANRGISTKNLPDAVNRGYGIITSKKMLTEGLGGLFIMMSGSAMLIKSERCNEYIELPNNLRCNGTLILCRMPYNSEDFNYINFVE